MAKKKDDKKRDVIVLRDDADDAKHRWTGRGWRVVSIERVVRVKPPSVRLRLERD